MAEDQGEERDGGSKDEGARRPMPIWVWVCVLGVLQAVLTFLGFYFLVPQPELPPEDSSIDPALAEEPEVVKEEQLREELEEGEELLGAIYPLELFMVNLKDKGVIRCEMQLVFKEREIPRRIYSRMPLIRDAIIAILSQKERQQMLTSKGKNILRKDVMTVINDRLRQEVVQDVLFTQYLIR
jgi:flagellar FliL protein